MVNGHTFLKGLFLALFPENKISLETFKGFTYLENLEKPLFLFSYFSLCKHYIFFLAAVVSALLIKDLDLILGSYKSAFGPLSIVKSAIKIQLN